MDKAEGERKASIEDSGHQLSFSSAVLMYITVSHRLPPGEEHGLEFNRFIKLHPSLHRSNTICIYRIICNCWTDVFLTPQVESDSHCKNVGCACPEDSQQGHT